MNRRRFLRDVAQVGMGLGIRHSLLGYEDPSNQSADKSGRHTKSLAARNNVVTLDGEWSIATDPKNVGRTEQWFASGLHGATLARVPGIIQGAFPAYHGLAWYSRHFTAPLNPNPQGRHLLRFGAVDYLADVWVNGVYVGGHEGSEAPFVLDVTDVIKPNGDNRVMVRVLNPSNVPIDGIVLDETPHQHKRIPYSAGLVSDYGGIIDSVQLLITPAVRVETLFVRPEWKTGKVRIQVNARNHTSRIIRADMQVCLALAGGGEMLVASDTEHELPPGDTLLEAGLMVNNPQLWDLQDPFLYRVTARLKEKEADSTDEASVCCGFRDFRVVNGYFQLNGRRIILRSSHTLNQSPIGIRIPPAEARDLLRRDMLYAKASGLNMIRFAVGIAYPYQLDLCDEIGIMVYEETFAADSFYQTEDMVPKTLDPSTSAKMKEQYDRSLKEMIVRDRNHASVVMWEMLNETSNGPVFRHAVESLALVRSLDDSRAVLLSSGRFDSEFKIGSVSNPGSDQWEHVWGKESPGAEPGPDWRSVGYPSPAGAGSFHIYPQVPQTAESNHLIRTLGLGSNPVYLAEYGIGSLKNVISDAAMYEQIGADKDLEDYVMMRSMVDRYLADWKRFELDGVYPFPEDLLRDSLRLMAHWRLLGFNLIRSNPKICGFNLTGMIDSSTAGGGLWQFWRNWKPGTLDAIQDGCSPLRWCLFVEPMHSYAGRPFRVEAVLANEDVLRSGEYPARFRICGPAGVVWEYQAEVRVSSAATGEDGLLAVPVMNQEIVLNGPAGIYELVASLERGGAPFGRSWQFYLSDAAALPRVSQTVTLWGIDEKVENWLKAKGVASQRFAMSTPSRREIILVGDVSKAGPAASEWRELARRMARGSVVLFLSAAAFQREKDSVGWLPLGTKGQFPRFPDVSIYHSECVAKAHALFDGLQPKGIMDWDYYGPLIPHSHFQGQVPPDDVVAVSFAVGHGNIRPGGYASGVLAGSYRCSVRPDSDRLMGTGMFFLNAFPILENVDLHPAADRLLLNLINYAARSIGEPMTPLPDNFDVQLKGIGYM